MRKHDRQFSIPNPFESEGESSRIFIDCFGSGDYRIEVRGKIVRFAWSERFGPMPLNRNNTEARSVGPKHPFWRAASLWNLQGQRIENGMCIWHEPRKPEYEITRDGRKHIITKVLHPGEEGWDW